MIESTFTTVKYENHRRRRAVIAPFFSKKSVSSIIDVVYERTGKLCSRLEEFRRQKTPVPISRAFLAITSDIISEYSMGFSNNWVENPDLATKWFDIMSRFFKASPLINQFPWITDIFEALPEKVAAWLNPDLIEVYRLKEVNRLSSIHGRFNHTLNEPLSTQEVRSERLWLEKTNPI